MRYRYKRSGRKVELNADESLVAVRFKEPAKYSTRAVVSRACNMGNFRDRLEVPEEKYTVLPVGQDSQGQRARHETAINNLALQNDVVRVTPVFKLAETKVIATDRVMFGLQRGADVQPILDKYKAQIVDQRGDEYVVALDEGTSPLDVANKMEVESVVVYAEPDFVTLTPRLPRSNEGTSTPAPTSDPQSHRQYAIRITQAEDAWRLQDGNPDVRIAILDEGVDVTHEDLQAAVVSSYDGVDDDFFQEPKPWDAHGTACAGLAGATHDNALGIKGISNGCSVQAGRIAYSASENSHWVTRNSWIVRAIDWAWQDGASVISNSWGGGAPSTAIENAFERARTQGREGKGAVIVVAAGNASGPVDFPGNLPDVLTVSASNEYDEFKTKSSRDGEYWWGSNFGPEVDIAAPGVHNWTTDISGTDGYSDGNYTNFNGTSSATPIVAGAAALVISADPTLTEVQVRERLTQSADKAGELAYVNGRNDQMGFGRLNVLGALQASQPQQAGYVAIHKVLRDVAIRDQQVGRLSVAVGDTKPIVDVSVMVEIEHTYIGDLQVQIVPPLGSGEAPIVLHDRSGRGADNLVRKYDTNTTPDLKRLIGKSLPGVWILEVGDYANQDEGQILSVALELTY